MPFYLQVHSAKRASGSRLACLALLFIALLGASCSTEPAVDKPNVLLITLDTLRADHLSCYGYEKETSPFLDSLAATGTRFDAAYAASNITKPSHASILTGLYPKNHGLLSNSEGLLNDAITTLAESFKDSGYFTFAVVGTDLLNDRRSGLGQGFDIFENSPQPQRRAEAVTQLAVDQLHELPNKPFFAWIHFYDPHIPYNPPKVLVEHFSSPTPNSVPTNLEVRPFREDQMVKGAIPASSSLPGVTDPSVYSAAYDGEIAYLDYALKILFNNLELVGRRNNTIVGITADHGEMLGERGIFYNHASLYEPVIRVPMILVATDHRLPPVVETVVENIDLGLTLLELAGLEAPSNLDAKSLIPALAGRASPATNRAFSQHSYDLLISLRTSTDTLVLPIPSAEKIIVTPFSRFDRSTYLQYVSGELPILISSSEPGQNIYSKNPERAQSLQADLEDWYAERRQTPAPIRGNLSEEEKRQLEALGYL